MELRTGYYGEFGGRFVAETLMSALDELEQEFERCQADTGFNTELQQILSRYVGRPTPITLASRLSEKLGARIWLKREDLCHTGAHKINNTIGQLLLAKRMGKKRIIAETGAGQHGVATATACALFGLDCEVYMGAEDVARQAPNVKRMGLLGAKVHAVQSGSRTLKDAMNEAMRDWVTYVDTTHYCVGSVAGPHPYPAMVRHFQRIIGDEARQQMATLKASPDAVVACVGGGSNAMGIFAAFIDTQAKLVGVEAAGRGVDTEHHAATLTKGRVGVLHGSRSMVLQSSDGQIQEAHSISAGLDYPGVGPEHAHLQSIQRAEYAAVTDDDALAAFQEVCKMEGIIPALETSHAFAYLPEVVKQVGAGKDILVCCSGRGDKDLQTVLNALEAS